MIEEYLEDNNPKGVVDYKFFCFHGESRLALVASNRQKKVNLTFSIWTSNTALLNKNMTFYQKIQ